MASRRTQDGSVDPTFAMTPTAFRMLGGPRTIAPCAKCGAEPTVAYLGHSVEGVAFVLDGRGQNRGRPAIEAALRCQRCGTRCTASVTADAAPMRMWVVFIAALSNLEMPAGRPERAAPAAAGTPTPPRMPIRPSVRRPDAPPIGIDEAITAIVAVRRTRTTAELLRVLGVEVRKQGRRLRETP